MLSWYQDKVHHRSRVRVRGPVAHDDRPTELFAKLALAPAIPQRFEPFSLLSLSRARLRLAPTQIYARSPGALTELSIFAHAEEGCFEPLAPASRAKFHLHLVCAAAVVAAARRIKRRRKQTVRSRREAAHGRRPPPASALSPLL